MKVKVLSKVAGKNFQVEGAPEAIGLHSDGEAVIFMHDRTVVLKLDREAAEAIAALYAPKA